MIYWQEECKRLAGSHSLVVVVDYYDENRMPVFAVRRTTSASGSRSGRNSYWNVAFETPLSDGCTAVAFPYVLAFSDHFPDRGDVIVSERLDLYHPAWVLTPDQEKELSWRKQSALHALFGGSWSNNL